MMAHDGQPLLTLAGVMLATLLLLLTAPSAAAAAPPAKKHVLFVISDDLRPTLGAYGTQALTPNVDALAARGLTFSRAYTQFPWCSPTRQSFMSGRRPDSTKAWTFTTSFRDSLPDSVSLSQHFRHQGWYTASVGKIYHGRNCVRGDPGCCAANATLLECVQQPQDADWAGGSWDERPVDFPRVRCEPTSESVNWCAGPAGVPDDQYCDAKIAHAATTRLRTHAARRRQSSGAAADGKPLALFVGFRDNHLPWASPPTWRALFNPANVKATVRDATPSFNLSAGGVPLVAWQFPAWVGHQPFKNVTALSDTHWLNTAERQEALRSYMSNIAFTDHQLGTVLATLDEVGYTNDTVVLFTGDHGQNIGASRRCFLAKSPALHSQPTRAD